MNFTRLQTRIQLDEGFRSKPYQDTVGVWTIGYGATTWDGKKVTEATKPVTDTQATRQLRADIYQACIEAQGLVGTFPILGDVRQEVLVNMAFNLGRTGLARFKKMLAALDDCDFPRAALEMKDSKWFHQVGERSKRLYHAMMHGEWKT